MKKNKYDYDKDYNEEYIEDKENNNYEEENKLKAFLAKYKSDKKYKAKVQLTGYLIFIIILVIYLNISNMGNNYNYNSTNTTNNQEPTTDNIKEDKDLSLLKKLDNNYNYSVNIAITRTKEDNTPENININYNGKSDNENIIINKVINNNTLTFYKAGDEYYKKNNTEYELMAENEIYDIISAKYIEYSSLKKYIEKASLDHYTNYSTGKVEYVYNLSISEIIKSYKKDDKIEIDIVEENDAITIDIDYANLFKVLNNKITDCKINYKYNNIGTTEKIIIFEEDNKTTSTTNTN